MGAAARLADQGLAGGVSLALAGEELSAATETAAAYPGVDRVCLLEHESLRDGGKGGFDAPVHALASLCGSLQPEAVIMAKSDFGANVAPRLAFRLGGGLAQDCLDLVRDPETGRLAVTRPVYGGNALAVYTFPGAGPQVATVRPGAFDAVEAGGGGAAVETHSLDGIEDNVRARLVEVVKEESEGVRLEDADVVVSGGRGLGGPEPFEQLRELADMLGGAVGASRAACDAGWTDHSYQVGLTGKSVAPRVYISVGISGASQHMAGISGAKNIVAINKDKDANIFKEAKFGVVGDWQSVLPAFIAAVQDLKG